MSGNGGDDRNGDDTRRRVLDLAAGATRAAMVQLAARLGLADLIADGHRDTAALARESGTDPAALGRLLRALAGFGLLAADSEGFALTPAGELLRRDDPESLHDWLLLTGEEWFRETLGAMPHAVMTGQPAFDHLRGDDCDGWLQRRPKLAMAFERGTAALAAATARILARAWVFGDEGLVIDIGGGGALLSTLLPSRPGLRGVVFDSPRRIAAASPVLALAGIADRCATVAGDPLVAVPAGGDIYVLANLLRERNDGIAGRLLASIREAAAPGSRLLVAEPMLLAGRDARPAAIADLTLMCMGPGRERTEAALGDLLAAAGYRILRLLPAGHDLNIIEAVADDPPA